MTLDLSKFTEAIELPVYIQMRIDNMQAQLRASNDMNEIKKLAYSLKEFRDIQDKYFAHDFKKITS